MEQGNLTCAVSECSACGQSHEMVSLVTGNESEEIAVCPTTNEVILRMDVNATDPRRLSLRIYPEEETVRKTQFKYYIKNCPSCGEFHEGYRGKLNAEDEEYVVCGNTNKKMRTCAHPEWTRMLVDGESEPEEAPMKTSAEVSELVKSLQSLRDLRPDIPRFADILRECESFDYPGEMIRHHGGIATNTDYNYVSSSFLNGLVNYAGVKVGFILNRYGLEHLETPETYATYSGLADSISARPHCTQFDYDDCILLGETDYDYWLFWYDKDASDCCVTRIEKAAYRSFEDFRLSVLEHKVETYENWQHSEAPFPELHEFKPNGWITW